MNLHLVLTIDNNKWITKTSSTLLHTPFEQRQVNFYTSLLAVVFDKIAVWSVNFAEWSIASFSRRVRAANTFDSSLVGHGVTPSWFTAVAHVSNIRHIYVFASLFLNNEPHFNVAFWPLTFRSSSEEHRWMHFAGIFWPHVIVLKAQTAPWVAFFYFTEKDSSPVATQQPAAARESVDGNSFPVFFRQLKPGCRPIEAHPEVLFTFSIFVIIRWIWFTLQWRKRTTRKISE